MSLDKLLELLLAPLFMMLMLGGCTAGIASPVVSPPIIFLIVLTLLLKSYQNSPLRLKKLKAFLLLGGAFSFMIAISMVFYSFGFPEAIALGVILISLIGIGVGYITRAKEIYTSYWFIIVKALTEPWAIGFIFGYLGSGIAPWIFFFLSLIVSLFTPITDNHRIGSLMILGIGIFYFWGGFLVVTVPFALTRIFLDLYTVLTRPFSKATTTEYFSFSWIITILFFLVVFSMFGCAACLSLVALNNSK